jgi:hypothetical protein
MDHAQDRAGHLIGTHQAVAHRYYKCPVCATDVFLRRGRKYQHHFAHRSGRGKPECELFHPSDFIGTTWTPPSDPYGPSSATRAIPPLALSIELEPEALIRGRRLRRWGLRLTVPKSDDEHGRVTIDFGTGHPKQLALSRLSLEAYTAVAAIDAQEFGASWISPEVRPNYRHAIEERIPGLDRTLINVFAPSNQKYKLRSDTLTWGNSYYFVWRADCFTEIHRGLSALPLAPQDDWQCSLVTLPDDEDAELKAWLDEHVGLNFNHQRRLFGIVIPAPCGMDVFGRPVVPDSGTLLVGVSLGQSDDDSGRKFSCSAGRESATVSISSSGHHLFEVGASLGKNALALYLDENPLPALAPFTDAADEHVNGVILEFCANEAKVAHPVALHQAQAAAALREVRAGRAALVNLLYPLGVTAQVRWRIPPAIEWQRLLLSNPAASGVMVAATADELLKVNSVIRDKVLDVQIDFGPFGSLYDGGVIQQSARPLLALTQQVRCRIIWLCKCARRFTDNAKRPIDILPDAALVAMFESLQVPAELAAHKVAVARDLQRSNARTVRS